jgi:ribonuclease P protein component
VPGLHTYPRRERLTRTRDYETVYRCGKKRVGREFVCYVARQEGQGRKIGLAVSRKVGKAVVRNRIKRYLRQVYRTHRAEIPDDTQVVFVARPTSARLSYHDCERAVCRLLKEGGALSG